MSMVAVVVVVVVDDDVVGLGRSCYRCDSIGVSGFYS
jgi:hypothetical protein